MGEPVVGDGDPADVAVRQGELRVVAEENLYLGLVVVVALEERLHVVQHHGQGVDHHQVRVGHQEPAKQRQIQDRQRFGDCRMIRSLMNERH